MIFKYDRKLLLGIFILLKDDKLHHTEVNLRKQKGKKMRFCYTD